MNGETRPVGIHGVLPETASDHSHNDVAEMVPATYAPKLFAINGRIGRSRFVAYSLGLYLILTLAALPLFILFGFDPEAGKSAHPAFVVLMVLAGLAGTIGLLNLMRRRLNDMNKSGWWLLLLLPVISLYGAASGSPGLTYILTLLMQAPLLAIPGTKGSNNWGSEPSQPPVWVRIVYVIYLLITIVPALTLISGVR